MEEACYWGILSRVNGLTHFQFVLSLCFVFAIEDVVFSLAAPAIMPVTCGRASAPQSWTLNYESK